MPETSRPSAAPSRAPAAARPGRALGEYALTAGELGAVSAQTVLVALLPVLLARYTSSALWIGFAVGGEGIFALLVPFWSGALSDRLGATRQAGRMAVVVVAALAMAAALAATPFLSGYWPIAVLAFAGFAALHAYLTPFWALLIDAVPDERRGRVQGVRGVLRSVGLGYGLVGAGLLFGLWEPLPFLVAAALLLATTAVTRAAALQGDGGGRGAPGPSLREAWAALSANRAAFWLLGADAFWNAAVDGIRPYVFLFAHRVLGTDVWRTSLGLLVLVTSLGAGSWALGRLGDRGDRGDRMRILLASSAALAAALAAGFLARNVPIALAVAAVAGVAAAGVMTLPYPLYASLVGEEAAGTNTGIFVVSVTVGRVGAPILVGGAMDAAARAMPRSHGYPVMWLVAAALAAGGWYCAWRSARARRAAPPRQRER